MRDKYRIALIVDDFEVPSWVRDLASWASDHCRIELVAIIASTPSVSTKLDTLVNLETRFLGRTSEYRRYSKLYPLGDGTAKIRLAPETGEATSKQLLQIQNLRLDAFVRCGRSLLDEEMLNLATDGIIAILTDADRCGSGTATGFAEAVQGKVDTQFTIARLKQASGSRDVLFRGSVATALLCSWTRISLQVRAFPYLQLILERLASGEIEPVREFDCERKAVRPADLLSYAARTAGRAISKAVRRASHKEFNWQVAFAREPFGKFSLASGNVIPNPQGSFLADPFTISVDGTDYLFVEEFPFSTRKGVISAYRIEGSEAERIGVVLEEPHHLSFPFVFEHKGEIYMVPESGGGRSITLYRSTSFPTGWVKEKVLMQDVPAVDTILFEHGSLWWMLTTIQGEGPALNNAELHAFYATDPLGEWTAHRANPIVMDARKGRNGGFLRDSNGHPCRVAQVPGFTFYGAGSAVYRIDELTPATYAESLVRKVEPTFFPNLDGTHHIHSPESLTVYDFLRVERPRVKAGKFVGLGEHNPPRIEEREGGGIAPKRTLDCEAVNCIR